MFPNFFLSTWWESINSATRRETVNGDSLEVIKTVDDNGSKLGRNFSSASAFLPLWCGLLVYVFIPIVFLVWLEGRDDLI